MALESFKDLIVWQKSFALVQCVYQIGKLLPKTEQFGLISQLQRSAVSIPSNIAEGQRRNNLQEYRQFLGIAKGSAGELETQLLLVRALYNLEVDDALTILLEVQKMLGSLHRKLSPNT